MSEGAARRAVQLDYFSVYQVAGGIDHQAYEQRQIAVIGQVLAEV